MNRRSISIVHPSYGRPDLAVKTATKWITSSADFSHHNPTLQYILVLAKGDPLLNKYLELIPKIPYSFEVVICPHANMVKQMNLGAKKTTGDVIIAVSDDFDCPDRWDATLLAGIGERTNVVVKTDDGVRNPGIDTENIIALPIMDRKFYNNIGGYIYHPSYNHFYGDEELSRVSDKMGNKVVVPMVFEHIHYMAGKAKEDDTNRKNNKFFNIDKATFIKRQRKNFPA